MFLSLKIFLLIVCVALTNCDGCETDLCRDPGDYDESSRPYPDQFGRRASDWDGDLKDPGGIDLLIEDPPKKRTGSFSVLRHGCIRRGDSCDHRPSDCCFSSSCRCNLWGANCRCQRMGLFQKLG